MPETYEVNIIPEWHYDKLSDKPRYMLHTVIQIGGRIVHQEYHYKLSDAVSWIIDLSPTEYSDCFENDVYEIG